MIEINTKLREEAKKWICELTPISLRKVVADQRVVFLPSNISLLRRSEMELDCRSDTHARESTSPTHYGISIEIKQTADS